jgi:hypothetical protein
MRKSELRRIIREEISNLSEGKSYSYAIRDEHGRPFLLNVGTEPRTSHGKSEYRLAGYYINNQMGFNGLVTAYFKDEKILRKIIDKQYHQQLDDYGRR